MTATVQTALGPVPAGALANSVQLRPAFSQAAGLTIRMRGTRYGKSGMTPRGSVFEINFSMRFK